MLPVTSAIAWGAHGLLIVAGHAAQQRCATPRGVKGGLPPSAHSCPCPYLGLLSLFIARRPHELHTGLDPTCTTFWRHSFFDLPHFGVSSANNTRSSLMNNLADVGSSTDSYNVLVQGLSE